jgi:hypothetical protein
MSFSSMQDMVICQKNPIEVFSNIGMKGITMKVADDNHFTVIISSVTNLLPQDFNGELAIIAESNGKKYILKSISKKLVFGVNYSSLFEDNKCSVEDLEDGEYRIYAAAKSKDDSDWQVFNRTFIILKQGRIINSKHKFFRNTLQYILLAICFGNNG